MKVALLVLLAALLLSGDSPELGARCGLVRARCAEGLYFNQIRASKCAGECK